MNDNEKGSNFDEKVEEHFEKKDKLEEQLEKKFTRRNFIAGTYLTVGGLVVGGGLGSLLGSNSDSAENVGTATTTAPKEMPNYTEALQFFTRKEDFDVLTAATEVIFPEDENGSGAIGLGVPYYIDKQLAGPWGGNAEDYMFKPFINGQTPLTRGDIMIQGVRKLDSVSEQKHGATFNSIEEEQQIAVLQEFESGNIKMYLVSSVEFFGLLRQLTLEGCYADPMYGGNKDMEGWKMKEFPGAYMSYTDVVESKKFVKKEPKSLSGHM
ncbi:gluconate 2-dehydrogenase subunit 3 family protein [Virgibacillus doumboii]|uniref:gluconate 2-dehydrogenase subunit 3 family protein n=1 Tax=Virgibacillus doumboii TaxID=2697503 RepID=UPI0013E09123|nr:gluconate 2-dehydrogenase subunit 3 family protein [Virgibacillus doumboii]